MTLDVVARQDTAHGMGDEMNRRVGRDMPRNFFMHYFSQCLDGFLGRRVVYVEDLVAFLFEGCGDILHGVGGALHAMQQNDMIGPKSYNFV